jgi:chromosomal replication initiation ATPase DnaA
MSLAARLLARTLPDDDRTWLDIVEEAATTEGALLADVLSGSRRRSPARARHRAWAKIHELSSVSIAEIARAFDVHHTTVLDTIDKYMREVEPEKILDRFPHVSAASSYPNDVARQLDNRPIGRSHTWLDVVRWAALRDGAELLAVLDGRRTYAATRARHRAWFELRKLTSASFLEIASTFGVTHHPVQAGVRQHRARLQQHPER